MPATSTTNSSLAAWLEIEKNRLNFEPEKVPDVITIEEAEAICEMLLHITIHLKRRRDRIVFVHRNVLIYNIMGKEKPQEQPKDLLHFVNIS